MNLLRTTSAAAHDWDLDPHESADLAESAVRLTGPVMVVDDEPMVRKSLANAIERIGARVVTAADGEEALRKFRELHNPLIFTDVRMPKLDGFGLLRSVKSLVPQTSVALITGFGSQELVDQAVHEGASYVLTKPFTFAEVSRILFETLQGQSADAWQRGLILTDSPRMESLLALARQVARTEATVVIQGETGTGKEMLARFIHDASPRRGGPFVAVNCSALPESLVESELFGHERGAFTGAVARRAGRFEVASGGTLVLDEVSEIPLPVQAKLLRVLQEREVHRVGCSHPLKVDVRVIAISNRDLRGEVQARRFRQDLFYRLNVVNLCLPPLRERSADIPMLCRHFLQKYAAAYGGRAEAFTTEAMDRLLGYSWPGNIRELENAIQGACIFASEREIEADRIRLDGESAALSAGGPTVVDAEKDLILATLRRLNGNRTRAAHALGISVRTVRNRLREYRLTSPELVS